MDSHMSNGLLFLFIFIFSNKTYATQWRGVSYLPLTTKNKTIN